MDRTKTLIVGIAASACGVLGAVVVVGLISFRGLAPRQELSASERALLVQVDDFVPFGITPRAGPYLEQFRAKNNVDGSLELEYEYESDEVDDEQRISIKSEAEICRDAEEAEDSFDGRVIAYKISIKLSGNDGVSLEERPGLLSLGDEHYSALLMKRGSPSGNMIVVRQDSTVFSLILDHVFVDDRSDLESLLAAKLGRAGSVVLE